MSKGDIIYSVIVCVLPTAFFVALALTLPWLWLKVVCWIIVAVIVCLAAFALLMQGTFGQIGKGGG